jgi:hypothetical protein
MTLEELAERAGLSARALGDLERGRSRGPQARTVLALTGALGLPDADAAALLAAARAGRRRPSEPAPALCRLPGGVPDFVGREEEMRWLRCVGTEPGPSRIAVVSGAPGMGKTALTVRAAWTMAEQHRDGCRFLNLRGLDAEPLDPHQALHRLLRALGVLERAIPADGEERRSLYLRLMQDLDILLVLDNAACEAQVRPLLPGAGAGVTWINSRRALGGVEHARRLLLDPLPKDAASDLLARIVGGGDPGEGDEGTLEQIAALCGNLPLALRIAGHLLVNRPGLCPSDLADRLGPEEFRLARLAAGHLQLEAAFALSYDQLEPKRRLLFRRLALVSGPDFGPEAGASVTGFSPDEAEQGMDELIEAGLLRPVGSDRAAFHGLLRLYARERLLEEDPQPVELSRN